MDKRFNPDRANVLIRKEREQQLPQKKVLKHLHLQEDDRIADLGCGPGYFTLPIAKKVQTVYALDIEPKMLKILKERASEESLENIQYVESGLGKIDLADDSIDKAIMAFVLHEVPDVDQTLNEIKRILTDDGQLLLLEWEKISSTSGPPLNHRIPSDAAIDLLKEHGFNTELHLFNRFNYGIKATKNN